MRVLGLDPGAQRTGYGVVEEGRRGPVRLDAGVVRLGRGALGERLAQLYGELRELLQRWEPHVCAVEGVFAHRNARSALILGQARGVCVLAAARRGLQVFEYSPARVKRTLTGSGAAPKDDVGAWVARLLDAPCEPSADASDALAVALCHLHAAKPLHVLA